MKTETHSELPWPPPWLLWHVPHDSTLIPAEILPQYAISSSELENEINLLTDHATLPLFTNNVPSQQVIYFPVSRLVLDCERFPNDDDEEMSSRGMGVIYTKTSDDKQLRHPLTDEERQRLINDYYHPHHARLNELVSKVLEGHGKALIIDSHSFASKALPHEASQRYPRPQICLGTDQFHTSSELAKVLQNSFVDHGFEVSINDPFAGTMISSNHYQKDKRVQGIMIEVNRQLYLDETTGKPLESMGELAKTISIVIKRAVTLIGASDFSELR